MVEAVVPKRVNLSPKAQYGLPDVDLLGINR
jgi:hypothetical protein